MSLGYVLYGWGLAVVVASLNFADVAFAWLLGPRELEPGYRARKERQERAKRDMERALGWRR